MDAELRLQHLLAQAIELDRATKGNIQVFDPEAGSLRIIAQSGFDEIFLHHFQKVQRFDSSACGRAFGTGNWVLIPDIMEDEAFKPHREVALASGIRSVKSIPVTGPDGGFQGMLSTHSATVRWDWQRDNTHHIAAEIATIIIHLRAKRTE
jgi:GAF domain-containing protein